MKPNAFLSPPYSYEDFFSRSLAYLINLLPDVGDRLMRRIAVLAGRDATFFGEFRRCDFVGSEFQGDHKTSRPDLKAICAKKTLYFENKLDSPLRVSQMEEHAALCRADGSALVFVSNIYHGDSQLSSLAESGYLHPTGRGHYLWLDLMPALEGPHDDRIASALLADFRHAAKYDGMIGRTIAGANGSLYTHGSEAMHTALSRLWDLMNAAGFKLARKNARETTIRAYPVRYQQYPLLNPRFMPTAEWIDEDWDRECLVLTVLSKGVSHEDAKVLDDKLRTFHSTPECSFSPFLSNPDDGYYYHGHFLLPLRFVGEGATGDLDFGPLKQPLSDMLTFLRRATR